MKRRTLAKLLSASAVLTLGGVGYTARARSRNPYYQGPVTDHFDGTRFHNPGPWAAGARIGRLPIRARSSIRPRSASQACA
jgi:hypothetical protein